MNCDLIIINAGQLLTLAGYTQPRTKAEMEDLGIIENGAIAVKNGIILECGKTEEIINKYNCENIIDAEGKVVMPGFVDAHTHTVFANTRENEFEMRIKGKTYVDIAKAGGGIRSSINNVRKATEDELFALAKNRMLKMIENGTTTVETKSGYGLTTESEIKMLKVAKSLQQTMDIDIVSTFMGAHEFPTEYKENHQAYIDILCNEMMPEAKKYSNYCDIFCEDHVYSIEETRQVLTKAKELGFKLKLHADEIEPIGGAELAAELGALTADHLGATSDKGIADMQKAGVFPVLLPATIFSLGMNSYARARKMIEEGLPVVLATDFNPGSCNCDSMQTTISIACIMMKMTPAEAITASTYNAAFALEMNEKIGSLEQEKQADILITDMPSYQYLPYHLGSNIVKTVIKKGKIIYQK